MEHFLHRSELLIAFGHDDKDKIRKKTAKHVKHLTKYLWFRIRLKYTHARFTCSILSFRCDKMLNSVHMKDSSNFYLCHSTVIQIFWMKKSTKQHPNLPTTPNANMTSCIGTWRTCECYIGLIGLILWVQNGPTYRLKGALDS